MRRLSIPKFDFWTTLRECIGGVDFIRGTYLDLLDKEEAAFYDHFYSYLLKSGNACFFNEKKTHGKISEKNLKIIYDYYFLKRKARFIYDKIMEAGVPEKCPYCAGIGEVANLDHYLPKSKFAFYSVMPNNLIPCCSYCNNRKKDFFTTERGKQPLHPYLDKEKFFKEKWIHARLVKKDPPIVEYFVEPPPSWSSDDKKRVEFHFEIYDLAKRFSIEGSLTLKIEIGIMRQRACGTNFQKFSEDFRQRSKEGTRPINSAVRSMYMAASESVWLFNYIKES